MLEIVPDIAQSTHGNRNIFADIRNVPTRPHTVLGMFLLAFSVAARLQENVCCSTQSGNHDASSLIFVIKLDLLCTLSMLEEVRRDSEVYWPQYSLRQVHTHKYTEMKPRTQLSE